MKNKTINATIDRTQSRGKLICGRVGSIYAFDAVVNKSKSNFGINKGKIVKLEIYGRFRQEYIVIYDKKWRKQPSEKCNAYYIAVVKLLENLSNGISSLNG